MSIIQKLETMFMQISLISIKGFVDFFRNLVGLKSAFESCPIFFNSALGLQEML